MRLIHKPFLFYIILVISLATTVHAKNSHQNVILILNASGSMSGRIDGTAKIDMTRSSISNLHNGWNTNTKTGVMTCSQRVKGDCNDIQILIPLSTAKKRPLEVC